MTSEGDVSTEDESEEETNLSPSAGWTAGKVYIYNILEDSGGYVTVKPRINMPNSLTDSSFNYFLYFLPVDRFRIIVDNMCGKNRIKSE